MIKQIIDNIEKGYIGKRETIVKMVAVLLAEGHLLIEDVPGVGKTTLAKRLAESVDCGFTRIQFTPDTLPSDIIGMTIYNMGTGKFETIQGAIMNNIIMADEINRTSPKTQASLLEAMEEKQVTIEGSMFKLPELFMVIATQNPVEYAGTYDLPEAELDRFMIRLSLGYPDMDTELKLIDMALTGVLEESLKSVVSEEDVLNMRKEVKLVKAGHAIRSYVTNIARNTRESEDIILGASPRAAIALLKMSQAMAYIDGRDYIIPDDVRDIAANVLAHRMIYAPSLSLNSEDEEKLVDELVRKTSIPDGLKNRK